MSMIPASVPFHSPFVAWPLLPKRKQMHKSRERAFTLVELLVVIGIVSVLIGLLLSAVQNVRTAAARADCQNRVKQLALALHNYHDTRQCFPPGHRSLTHPDRMPFSGWTVSVLPYIEQATLNTQAQAAYRVDRYPFHNPPHTGLNTVVPAFICPLDSRITTAQRGQRTGTVAAFTSYLGVAGLDAVTTRNGMLFQDSATRLTDVPDGTSNTLLLGERPPSADFQFGWWYAGAGQQLTGSADLVLGAREPNLLLVTVNSPCGPGRYLFTAATGFDDPCGMFHFWSPHTGGANFAFADGSVRFIKYTADPIMPALATRAGGESVTLE
jgi:prepilin-type processing-associated H-X9-DG protein/prepilin-type N-terminal cleavage/methylation domain-containing protein